MSGVTFTPPHKFPERLNLRDTKIYAADLREAAAKLIELYGEKK